MSDFTFYGLFWAPLLVGLAFQVFLFDRLSARAHRVLIAISLLVICSGLVYELVVSDSLTLSDSLVISVGTAAPTFLAALLTYEITALLTEERWARVSAAIALGALMAFYSIVIFFWLGCLKTGDCL